MKVYLVIEDDWDGNEIIGVFATEESASRIAGESVHYRGVYEFEVQP